MKPKPCFMLARTESAALAGMKPIRIISSAAIGARNEIPFSEKHQTYPSLVKAMPPSTGPITRARLN